VIGGDIFDLANSGSLVPLEIAAGGRINRPPLTHNRFREVFSENFRANITSLLDSLTAYSVCFSVLNAHIYGSSPPRLMLVLSTRTTLPAETGAVAFDILPVVDEVSGLFREIAQ
jgi:hypothetical protein